MIKLDTMYVHPSFYIMKGDEGDFVYGIAPLKDSFSSDVSLAQIFSDLGKSFTAADFIKDSSEMFDGGVTEADLEAVLDQLLDLKVLLSKTEIDKILGRYGFCFETLPPGWYEQIGYQESTRDYPFFGMNEKGAAVKDNRLMQEYHAEEKPPSVYLERGSGQGIQLEMVEEIINEDRFEGPGLTKLNLNLMLDHVFGERSRYDEKKYQKTGYLELEKLLKAVPSGGGRHPTECYVINEGFEGIDKAVYHFSVKLNALATIGKIPKKIDGQLHLVLTCLVERAMWRYRDHRSYRALPVDVGHALGLLESTCDFLELDYTLSHNANLGVFNSVLGVDGNNEIVMACLTIKAEK